MSLGAGCAQPGEAPARAAAMPAAPVGELARYNGWYQGHGVPVTPGVNCRDRTHSVWFRVEDGLVEMRSSRHRRSAVTPALLSGTLSPGGQVALRGATLESLAAGQIAGRRVTVEDASPVVVRDGRPSCRYRYEAEFREELRN